MPLKSSTWAKRQAAIRQILAREKIRSQGELLRRLKAKGFEVTQSSISRDLQELGAIKVDGRYLPSVTHLQPAASPADELKELAATIRSFRPAGPNLMVVTTPAGLAPAVSIAFDKAGWPEIVGTLAGDDTFFIATAGRPEQARVEAWLKQLTKEAQHVRL